MAGVALRHYYLYAQSWPRVLEMMYWPMLNMILFGYVSLSMLRLSGNDTTFSNTYLCGVMLTEIVIRTTVAEMIMYMEEVWSRNLGHLFASPLRLRDYAASLMALSSLRCVIALVPAAFLVYVLFDFSILQLGWGLPLYAFLLTINGWWYGLLIISMLLRFGLAAEWLGWMCTWVLLPFMAPYYPVSILPPVFQAISWLLPGTYVFESMKVQMATGSMRFDLLGVAVLLNAVYVGIAAFSLARAFKSARRQGGLLQMGE